MTTPAGTTGDMIRRAVELCGLIHRANTQADILRINIDAPDSSPEHRDALRELLDTNRRLVADWQRELDALIATP